MILQELCLTNFGLFRGVQKFDLTPTIESGSNKPIVLIGGMNGGGKTTLFDGLQLALYGSRARCSKRSGRSYEEFLRDSINNRVSPEVGAGVALSFSFATNGVPTEFIVKREWQVISGKVKESLTVHRGGYSDQSLTQQWAQIVEELIPLEISQLFFFDAEKIRALAEDASSSETLGTAIKTLLGLDIVERLIADTTVLQTRTNKKLVANNEQHGIAELEKAQINLREELSQLQTQRASLENDRLRAESEVNESEDAFSLLGGKHWEQRQSRREKLAQCDRLSTEIESQLITLASTELPLILVRDLVQASVAQDAIEHAAAIGNAVCQALLERDEAVLAKLESKSELPKKYLRIFADVLEIDRVARTSTTPANSRLKLTENGRAVLSVLQDRRLNELKQEASNLVNRLADSEKQKEDLERLLASTPDEADLNAVFDRVKMANQTLAKLNEKSASLDKQIAAKKFELGTVERRLQGFFESQVKQGFDKEDLIRMNERIVQTRKTMQEFLHKATEQKIERLSVTISDSFRYLLRKRTLVERIHIEPTTFAVTLYDNKGTPLPRHRLSEGEKQIFAISMLWGLARASLRPLPTIIDTPMARLDAKHREHLVQRYFPEASHQVIILSTDTEVDKQYYSSLKPRLARSYQLDYDERERKTVGKQGYFWCD